MALIKCPECGKNISNTAKVCPNCGFKKRKVKKQSQSKKTIKDIFEILGMLDVLAFVAWHKNVFILIISLASVFLVYNLLISIIDYLKE